MHFYPELLFRFFLKRKLNVCGLWLYIKKWRGQSVEPWAAQVLGLQNIGLLLTPQLSDSTYIINLLLILSFN